MPTGNAIQTATVVSGGGGGSTGTSTVTIALLDATGTVNVGNATAPGAAGSVLTSSDTTDAIWSTTTGTTGSAGFATNSGTSTVAGFATNAGTATVAGFATNAGTSTLAGFATNAGTATVSGTATIANALTNTTGTVDVSQAAAPAAAGSVLTSAGVNTSAWSTTVGTVGSAGLASFAANAGTATTTSGTATFAITAGTATIANALTNASGTVNVSAATAPGAAGSVLISASANTATWGVVTAAAGAPPGAAVGTLANITAAGPTDMGPSYTVPANTVGTGTAYHMQNSFSIPSIAAAGTGTFGVYWGGVAGARLATIGGTVFGPGGFAGGTMVAAADLYWENTSAVSVMLSAIGTIGGNIFAMAIGSVVTGLTTTSNEALTFGWSWNHAGSGTVQPLTSYVNQVH
jgi:hypothetical protein